MSNNPLDLNMESLRNHASSWKLQDDSDPGLANPGPESFLRFLDPNPGSGPGLANLGDESSLAVPEGVLTHARCSLHLPRVNDGAKRLHNH